MQVGVCSHAEVSRESQSTPLRRRPGEYRTSVAYYFGGKRGLLAAIADETCPTEACNQAVAECEKYEPGNDRVAAQMAALRSMAEDEEAFRAMFELIPYMLRDDDLRANLAALYDWYREVDEQMFGVTASDPEDLKYAAAFERRRRRRLGLAGADRP